MNYRAEYQRWLATVVEDDLKTELKNMDEAAIEDAFYRDLAFGTGGLRGTIGAGTNRMNVHVVGKASQGLSRYLLDKDSGPSVVIGFDSRIGLQTISVALKNLMDISRVHMCGTRML